MIPGDDFVGGSGRSGHPSFSKQEKKITVLRRLLLSATNVKLVLCVRAGHIVYAIVKADILDAILYQYRLVGHKGSTDST